MSDQNQNTTSLALAAYFCSTGIDCLSITLYPSSSQFSFEFNLSPENFQQLSDQFWSKKTNVDALSYFEALKVLKSRMYQYKYQKDNQYERTNLG